MRQAPAMPAHASIASADITGLLLAGGRGSRMGGVDKGLQPFNGQPLALHAMRRLTPQVGPIMVNANRNLAEYEALGAPVWPDSLADHAGPLAGFLTGLEHCATPWLLTVPCDTPLFPLDLAARLAEAAVADDADIAMATAPEPAEDGGPPVLRPQPVFCLLRVELELSVQAKAAVMVREAGVILPVHDDARHALDEVHYLRASIGPTGVLALKPFGVTSHRDDWHRYLLAGPDAKRSTRPHQR